jgi:hypothetical protein
MQFFCTLVPVKSLQTPILLSGRVLPDFCRYVIVYFSILFIRYRAGIVSKEMLALPKSRFMLIGLLEAMGVASGMAAAGDY